jgi:hypothetical protein
MGRFDSLDASQRELLSKADESYTNLLKEQLTPFVPLSTRMMLTEVAQ